VTTASGEALRASSATHFEDVVTILTAGRQALDADDVQLGFGRVGRNDSPALLFDLWTLGLIDLSGQPSVVAAAWTAAEYPSASLSRRLWIAWFRAAAYPAPDRALTIYRGSPPRCARGMAWTTRPEKAEWFAGRLGMNSGRSVAHVYTVDAAPEAVLADVDAIDSEGGRGEGEIVVDTSMIGTLRRLR
jgi:hypothetical protein